MEYSVVRLFLGIVSGLVGLGLTEFFFEDHIHKLLSVFASLFFFILSVPLTRYGIDVLLKMMVLIIPLVAVPFFLDLGYASKAGIVAGGLAMLGITLQFLRSPKRIIPNEDGVIVSPADGKVLFVSDIEEAKSPIGEAAHVVAIFMSPFSSHVNRVPVEGSVIHVEYRAGTFLEAFKHESGEVNEQTKVIVQSENGYKVAFKQISGYVARRIVCNLKIGDKVKRGQKFGMIKFGSRSDVFVPKRATIFVKQGERVKAGSTIIAKL